MNQVSRDSQFWVLRKCRIHHSIYFGHGLTVQTFEKWVECSKMAIFKWVKRSMLKIKMIGSWFSRPQYWSENVCIIEFRCEENEVQEHFWKWITGQKWPKSWKLVDQTAKILLSAEFSKIFLHENCQFLKIFEKLNHFYEKMLKLGFNSQVIIGWKFKGLTLSG